MDYLPIEQAREGNGLRLVLTQGVPGPWGEAAKAIFHVKRIPYLAVGQTGGGDNSALVEWTGHANAPTAVWNDEPPRAGRNEILLLAERIAPDPALLPSDPEERAIVFGIWGIVLLFRFKSAFRKLAEEASAIWAASPASVTHP